MNHPRSINPLPALASRLEARDRQTYSRQPNLFSILLCALTLWAWPAASQVSGPWRFTVGGGSVTVTAYMGGDTNLVVPDTLGGLPVTRVGGPMVLQGPASFRVENLTLPASITNIATGAFASAGGLRRLTILGDVKAIPAGMCIGAQRLASVTLPDTITTIGEDAFNGCVNLTGIEVPDGVTRIGDRAFEGCRQLSGFDIPEGATHIGSRAFWGAGLTQLRIPGSVVSIGASAFRNCQELAAIEVDPANPGFVSLDGLLFNRAMTSLLQCPGGRVGSVEVPSSVTTLGPGAFGGCVELTSIALPDTVTAIPAGAFYECRKFSAILLPAGITSIGEQAFSMSGITNLVIPASVTILRDETFSNCPELVDVTLPEGLQTIGQAAFAACPKLAQVRITRNVTSIGTSSFRDCTRLTAITVDEANPNFASVDGVLFDKALNRLRVYPAGKSGDYTVPESVLSIGETAFSGAARLTSLDIPNAVTALGIGVFQNCSQLASVRIGSGITTIPQYAFASCTNLSSVRLPETVRTLSDGAFFQCLSLRSIVIPASVRTLGSGVFEPQSYSPEPVGIQSVFFQGNAPTTGSQGLVFQPFELGPTVYYRAGTTGWTAEFAGRPAVLWDPRVADGVDAPGVRDGQFRFKITGSPGIPVVVEATERLGGSDWTTLGTFTVVDGTVSFADPDWQQHPGRFYRFRAP